MQYLFEAWCRDPRPLLFGEYLDQLYRSWDSWTPASPIGQELADLYRESHRRIRADQRFAVCYLGVDHLKKYNERHGDERGKKIVSILSTTLRNAVRNRCPSDGFVAYLGGGNFIFLVTIGQVNAICGEVCDLFDKQVPRQDEPTLALSIGVVTNEERAFVHFSQITELVIEMKSYAETLPDSVFVVDRRHEPDL